jgi:hypothetical protein
MSTVLHSFADSGGRERVKNVVGDFNWMARTILALKMRITEFGRCAASAQSKFREVFLHCTVFNKSTSWSAKLDYEAR